VAPLARVIGSSIIVFEDESRERRTKIRQLIFEFQRGNLISPLGSIPLASAWQVQGANNDQVTFWRHQQLNLFAYLRCCC
jgi:hypothetical protein